MNRSCGTVVPDGQGRPWAATRGVLNAVLWILRTGAPWADLPRRYPTYTKPAIAASKSGSDRAASYGIEMIAANRRGRARTQDRRPLRRIRRRWKIERFFAWLHNSQRVVTRWERRLE